MEYNTKIKIFRDFYSIERTENQNLNRLSFLVKLTIVRSQHLQKYKEDYLVILT